MGSKRADLGAAKPSTADEGPSGNSSPDVVDLDYLRRFTMGNAALEEEVLRLFVNQTPLYLEQLRNARSTKEWGEAAHTLKGSAGAIGARRLTSVAEMVERLDIDSAGADGDGFREQAIEAVAGALEEVNRHISGLLAPK